MAMTLLIAGIVFFLVGLLQVAAGIPVKEFSFGNTLMITGAVTACTGVLMIGLWVVTRELRKIGLRLGTAVAAPARPAGAFPSAPAAVAPRDPAHDDDGFAVGHDHPASNAPEAPPAMPSPPPWHEESASRDRGRGDVPAVPTPAEAAASVKQRRNLLFSSTSRKERERAEARGTDAPEAVAPPAPPVVAPPHSTPAPRASETPPATFEEAWPSQRRNGRTPSTFAEASAGAAVADRAPPADPAPVTVLKSGVVDGMAYSLYSDGSIEAQMPEGMMRFASIDELRAHLDQRGG
jgi:hypothetical protein